MKSILIQAAVVVFGLCLVVMISLGIIFTVNTLGASLAYDAQTILAILIVTTLLNMMIRIIKK